MENYSMGQPNNFDSLFSSSCGSPDALFEAQEACLQEIALNPNNNNAIFNLGRIEYKMGNKKDGLARFFQAIEIAKKNHGENDCVLAKYYYILGKVYKNLEDYRKALDYFKLTFEILCSCRSFKQIHPAILTTLKYLIKIAEKLQPWELIALKPIYALCMKTLSAEHMLTQKFSEVISKYETFLAYGSPMLLIQAQEVYEQSVEVDPNDIAALINLGIIEAHMGNSKEALTKFLKAVKITKQKYGENHSDVAICYSNIGRIYYILWDYEKALESYQKALRIQLQILGENHPDVADGYNNIGNTYTCFVDYEKALEYHQKALKIQLQVLDDNNYSHVADSYNNIGNIYRILCNYKQALKFHREALRIQVRVFGENHPNVAKSYNNLGGVYHKFWSKQKALECYEHALKIQLQILGEEHPDVADSYNNIGYILGSIQANHCEKDYETTLEYYQKALKIQVEVFGKHHPAIAHSYYNIGVFYEILGDYQNALEFYNRALKIQLCVFGKTHPDAADSYYNIGQLYKTLGDDGKALDHFKLALEIWCSSLKKSHPYIIKVLVNLIDVAANLQPWQLTTLKATYDLCVETLSGEHELTQRLSQILFNYEAFLTYESFDAPREALDVYQQAVALSPNNVYALINLGVIQVNMGNNKDALTRFFKALEIVKEKYGENHADVAICYNSIGRVYYILLDYKKAFKFYQRALKIQSKVLDENDHHLADSYINNGNIYRTLGDDQKALEFYQKALKIQARVKIGRSYLQLAVTHYNLGQVYDKLGDYEKALNHFSSTLADLYSSKHFNSDIFLEALDNLINIAKKLQPSPAQFKIKKWYEICLKALGEEHELTQQLFRLLALST